MTQYNNVTIDPTVTNGSQLAANINSFRAAGLSMHSGVERPAYATSGTMWISTASKPWKLYVFDGAADVAIGEVDPDGHGFLSAGGTEFTNDLMTAGDAADALNKLGAYATNGGTLTGFMRVLFDGATLASFQASGESDARIEFRSNNGANSYVEVGQRNNGDGFIWSRGREYTFGSDGRLSNGSWNIYTDGNIGGSVWGNWGSNDAFNAISNRIESRASAYANSRAAAGARVQHDSGTYEIGTVQTTGNTVDCPDGMFITGLRCQNYDWAVREIYVRAKYARNQ
ncbi:hypothetical protein JET14_08725 [Martelella lutilitoris]|uniref:Uncharacterized protein n=1 Tax=Martelella lutilitoris TaxID=2583532 RepID=A0A7T7HNA7_9HYPH|nr:hypothetical protein [Martelella lutilitoris]QQM32203.1 hypothetical protein JET14_08725 [Martelella lutilitoris]